MTDLELQNQQLTELVPFLEELPQFGFSSLDKIKYFLDQKFMGEFSDGTRVLLWTIAIAVMASVANPLSASVSETPRGEVTAANIDILSMNTEIQQKTPRQRQEHQVRPGENLDTISLQYGLTVAAIMAANEMTNKNLIWAGMKLVLPSEL